MKTTKMPVVFIGHGSPMNALENNDFTKALSRLGSELPRPKAILAISAHWMSRDTYITSMSQPETIHDFYGFPDQLFEIQYSAPGNPALAAQICREINSPVIIADETEWGLDHGTWSVLKHIYPLADIPVLQLSIDMSRPNDFHFELGKKLSYLREQEVLILGSGNIVHNLRRIRWEPDAKPFAWAIEFDEWAKNKLETRDFNALANDAILSEAGRLSVPTPDHYYPLLYILGASSPEDELHFIYEGIQNASISMRCLRFG